MESSCPEEARLLAFIEAPGAVSDWSSLAHHVPGCDVCRWLLSGAGSSVGWEEGESGPWQAVAVERRPRLGRYIVGDLLGTGGMGAVFTAYDPELEREVALKIVRPDRLGANSARARAGLVSEARAAARLNHPNVTTIYDGGSIGDEVYIAMERVHGVALSIWLMQRPRDWREIARVFASAAEGLAAAHAAGIIHRDVKPANILVGQDGAVKVSDFGLAVADGLPTAGSLAGTPAYMSPEQSAGGRIDARSDQYSLCVALHMALYGVRPGEARVSDAADGSQNPHRRVPRRLSRVVLRGLADAPGDRYPDMGQLARALRRCLGGRRRGAWVGAALAAAVMVFAMWPAAATTPACPAPTEAIHRVWNASIRGTIVAAGQRDPDLRAVAEWTVRELDEFVAAWSRRHVAVCRDTRVLHTHDAGALELRHACLDRVLRRTQSLAEMFARDPRRLEYADKAIGELDVSVCDDLEALNARMRGRTAAQRALMASYEAQEDVLLNELAMGELDALVPIVEALHIQARAAELPLLEASAYLMSARIARERGANTDVERDLLEALWASKRADDARTELLVAIDLVDYYLDADAERAAWWEKYMDALAVTQEGDAAMTAVVAEVRGRIAWHRGDFQRASAHLEQVLEMRTAAPGADDPKVATAHTNLGIVLGELGRSAEALHHYESALRIRSRVFGPTHARLVPTWSAMGSLELKLGHYREARTWFGRARAALEAAHGLRDARVVAAKVNLANAERGAGNLVEARRLYEEVLAAESAQSTPGRSTAIARIGLAKLAEVEGDPETAAAAASAAVDATRRAYGADHPTTASALQTSGEILLRMGRYESAVQRFEQALAIWERKLGSSSPRVAVAQMSIAMIDRRSGRRKLAIRRLEQALAAPELPDPDRATAELELAFALWPEARTQARAVELAQAARKRLEPLPDQADQLAAVMDWLRTRGSAAEAHMTTGVPRSAP